jgi:hypothetical protein
MASHDRSDVIRIEDFACPGFLLECQPVDCGKSSEYAENTQEVSLGWRIRVSLLPPKIFGLLRMPNRGIGD